MYQHSEFGHFHIVDHPLILHKLTQMRAADCAAYGFRTLLREISLLIGYEITRGMALSKRTVMTPMTAMTAPVLAEPAPCIVPVLRAGLGMAEGLLDLMPTAQVGHIGLYRDHDSKQPVEYLNKLPKNNGQWFFVTDPMLATGNSLAHACDALVAHGIVPEKIRAMSLVAAPEGVRRFYEKHPQIRVYCAALDERLDANAYILPGLGDAGDRMFGTV